MRLQVLASLAAVATAADNFEDDDVNFLRFLSSNATVNGTTTATPVTTTQAPNTTTAAPTTTTANVTATTTAAPTTTAAATTTASSNATQAATTTQGGQGQEGTTTGAPQNPTVLCSAASYAAVGLPAPATFLDTMTDFVYMVTCAETDQQVVNKEGDESTAFYTYGSRATPQANKDKCVSPGVLSTVTCGTALSAFNGQDDVNQKRGLLQKCCGASPGFAPSEVANFKSVGSVTWGNYSDSGCSTAQTAATSWPMSHIMTANPMTFTMGSCFDGGPLVGGTYIKFSSCNATHLMDHKYLDSACTDYVSSSMNPSLGTCNGGGANNTAFYEKWTCTAEAPATKQFSTTLAVDFGGLAGLSATQLTAVKDAYEPKALATFTTALNNADATITPSHTYTGALATSRRRLAASRRRLSGTGGVTSVFVTTLPAAAADTAQASIVTATSGAAALTPSAFKSTIETELASNTATSSFASNITATVAAPVVTQTTAAPGGGGGGAGSTSGAVTNLLGLGSALLMAVAVMF